MNPSCKNVAAPSSFDVDPDRINEPAQYITGTFMAVLVAILLVATSSAIELRPKAIIVGALLAVAAFLMNRYLPARGKERLPGRDLVADQEDLSSPGSGAHL